MGYGYDSYGSRRPASGDPKRRGARADAHREVCSEALALLRASGGPMRAVELAERLGISHTGLGAVCAKHYRTLIAFSAPGGALMIRPALGLEVG